MNDHENHMQKALQLAREAGEEGEIPVGCIVLDPDGKIIGRGRNRRESSHDATAHAEIEAIRQACAERGDWRLSGCSIFVTLEPCPMCAGAILNARISRIIFGAREPNSGSCGSVVDLFSENYGQHPAVYAGICADESKALLRDFFRKREENPAKPGA